MLRGVSDRAASGHSCAKWLVRSMSNKPTDAAAAAMMANLMTCESQKDCRAERGNSDAKTHNNKGRNESRFSPRSAVASHQLGPVTDDTNCRPDSRTKAVARIIRKPPR